VAFCHIFQEEKGEKMQKIPAKKRKQKVLISVRQSTAQALGMSSEAAEIRVNAILQRHKIKPDAFLSVLLQNGKPIIRTRSVNIECDINMITSIVLNPAHTTGRAVTNNRNAHPAAAEMNP
jgi:hypothetical protein